MTTEEQKIFDELADKYKVVCTKLAQYEVFFESFKQILKETKPVGFIEEEENSSPVGQSGFFG